MPHFKFEYSRALGKCLLHLKADYILEKTIQETKYYFISNTVLSNEFNILWGKLNVRSESIHRDIYLLFEQVCSLSFILIDESDKVHLFSDPLGFHPLFFGFAFDKFICSDDQLRVIKELNLSTHLSEKSVASYLHNGHLIADQSWFKDVNRMKAASHYILNKQCFELTHDYYWTWSEINKIYDNANIEEYIDSFGSCFEQLNNNLNYILGLSGGLESRWIASCGKNLENFSTYTFAESGTQDLLLAQKVANRLSLRHTHINIGSQHISDRLNSFIQMQAMVHLGHIHEGNLLDDFVSKYDVLLHGFYGGYEFHNNLNSKVNFNIASSLFDIGDEISYFESYFDFNCIDPFISNYKVRNQAAFTLHRLNDLTKVVLPFYNMRWIGVNYSIDDNLQKNKKFYMEALNKSMSRELCNVPWQKTGIPIKYIQLNSFILKFRIHSIREKILNYFGKTSHFINYAKYDVELDSMLSDYSAKQFCSENNMRLESREQKWRVLSLLVWKDFLSKNEN